MNNDQELRARSLEIAVLLLGKIPETNNNHLSDRFTYDQYFLLADKLQKYIETGQFPETK